MKYIFTIGCMILFHLLLAAQPTNTEQMLNQLETSGTMRRVGKNILEFKVEKPSDSIRLKKKYGHLFKKIDGSFYQVRYVSDKTEKKNNDPTSMSKTNAVLQDQPIVARQFVSDGCFSNIKTFGYTGVSSPAARGTNFSEYMWTVPNGVSKIKVEGWSAGGDGLAYIFNRFSAKAAYDSIAQIAGGGGGGGAYVLMFVEVKPGDIFKIRIPGGGSGTPLIIQNMESDSRGYLNVQSGHSAKTGSSTEFIFDGKGGFLSSNTGAFLKNIFSLRGADGEPAEMPGYRYYRREDIPTPGPLEAPHIMPRLIYDEYYGDGGDAPHSMHGGKAGFLFNRNNIWYNGKDGGYPGGGGGGGLQGRSKSGRGAPGLLIIYY